MGKYVIYGVIIFIALLLLNWFKIINIPLLDIPDFTNTKQEIVTKTQDTLKQLDLEILPAFGSYKFRFS